MKLLFNKLFAGSFFSSYLALSFEHFTWRDVLDILCLAVLFFCLYLFVRDRRAGKLLSGVVIVVVLLLLSELFDMYAFRYIIGTFFGYGLVILAIIFGILGANGVIESLSPAEVCMGVLTISLLAFVAAGITVVYHIEQLPLFCAILLHGIVLYGIYLLVYLLNGWLQSQMTAIMIFTGIFVTGYAVIWLVIYITTRSVTRSLNKKLQ
jgi:hypothetical protein